METIICNQNTFYDKKKKTTKEKEQQKKKKKKLKDKKMPKGLDKF